MKKRYRVGILLTALAAAGAAHGNTTPARHVKLFCHRTANEDVPENTLESLEQAALLGCDVVEMDVRRTLDGKIVLNHDGFLERLTEGVGTTEETYFDDLELRNTGAWMGQRYESMRIPLFEEALRLARARNIRLVLDMKTEGIGADVLALLRQEHMLEHVRFGGAWQDVKRLYPEANSEDAEVWVQPGVTAKDVSEYHRNSKQVVANFSANSHAMDLAAMKAAVAAGVDGINVDFPRLGADAAGRPVEAKLATLASQANTGDSIARGKAILELARYRGFPLQGEFAHWLLDQDDHVSRAAALALVAARPKTPVFVFDTALRSEHITARKNAAWALGILQAPAQKLLPLLQHKNPGVLQQALLSISRMPGQIEAARLLPLLKHPDGAVRGAAAVALARHQPQVAVRVVPAQLRLEMKTARAHYEDYVKRGTPQLSQAEIAQITGYFRCEMKMVQAIAMLQGPRANKALEEQAFRPGEDFSQMNGLVAGFQLWDRLGTDPNAALAAVQALGVESSQVADRAEWMLVEAGPAVLPEVRKALRSANSAVRVRAIHIVAWQGDLASLDRLRTLQVDHPADAILIGWAVDTIKMLHSAG